MPNAAGERYSKAIRGVHDRFFFFNPAHSARLAEKALTTWKYKTTKDTMPSHTNDPPICAMQLEKSLFV